MATDNKDKQTPPPTNKDELVQVPASTLAEIQKSIAKLEQENVEKDGLIAGMQEMIDKGAAAPAGEKKLREKKSFEPKFRTVRLRKYPKAGGEPQYVVGWTEKGAYQEVDRSGTSPQVVDFIDVIFLGYERNDKGVLQAEKVKLLDLLNKGVQVNCKILNTDRKDIPVPTGEEIDVTAWDPQHGLVSTGDKIDGYVAFSEITYTLQVPDVDAPVEIDGEFVN